MLSQFPIIGLFFALFIIALAARQMGDIFARVKLPLISGFLFVGIITGPFLLDFIHLDAIPQFLFLDELSLAFIAFAAGGELELKVIRGYFRSIISIITWQVIFVLAIGITSVILIADLIPFTAGLPQAEILAIAILTATIMIARSPSSALAIIKEVRARGRFTHKMLGTTVLADAVVIIFFAAGVSVAAVLVEGATFDAAVLIFVLFEIFLDIVFGILIGLLLRIVITIRFDLLKMAFILGIGYSVFLYSTQLHDFQLFGLPFGIFSEPLLICMTAGFFVTNFTDYKADFQHLLEELAPFIFILFFTLVGIELELDVLSESWLIVLILFAVRIVGIFLGSLVGTTIARDTNRSSLMLGLGFITQAGVSVGLAKEIGVEFPEWGPELATLSIGVIVINQIIGPPILKWVINFVGEAHTRAEPQEFDGVRDVIIFGLESQSLALARQLNAHNWEVKIASQSEFPITTENGSGVPVKKIKEFTTSTFNELGMELTDGVVLMLSDEENYRICEIIYENYGIRNVIVRLQDRANFEKFHDLGALVVDPDTAIVSLLDHFVRSPLATTLLLGLDVDEDIIEVELCNPELHGIPVRDIGLPLNVLILSINRNGHRLMSHGYTRLERGDHVAMVGPPEGLAEVMVRFEC